MALRLTADDFFTGLFSALALKDWSVISLRGDRFDAAVARVFSVLERIAKKDGYDLRFRVRLHPLHSDSSTVRDSVTSAVKRDLISLDNPVFQDIRLKMTKTEARGYLSTLPGGEVLFSGLADEFSQEFRAFARTHNEPEAPKKLPAPNRAFHGRIARRLCSRPEVVGAVPA
jgi:hypothetical protein